MTITHWVKNEAICQATHMLISRLWRGAKDLVATARFIALLPYLIAEMIDTVFRMTAVFASAALFVTAIVLVSRKAT